MPTEPTSIPTAQVKAPRVRSEFRFPVYDLADCVVAAKAIRGESSGKVTHGEGSHAIGQVQIGQGFEEGIDRLAQLRK